VLDPEITHEDKLRFAERFCRTRVISKAEALRVLLHCDDRWICACSLHTIGELGLTDLGDELQRVCHEGDALLEETWTWANARLAAGTAL